VPGINQATCGDGYTAAATISDVWNPGGGWFSVSTHAVLVSMQYPIQVGSGYGQSEWTDEQLLGDGAFGLLPPGATGIRFRNAVAGQNAVVTAAIAQGNEPALAISATGTLTVVGPGVNFQHNDAAVATEPTIDFEDGSGVTWTLTDDPAGTRVKVALAVSKAPAPTHTVLTGGAGTYNTPSGCRAILVECIGGGAGGGGTAALGAGASAAGGGGGGGAYSASLLEPPAASYAYSVGGGGNGGAGVGGAAGGSTSFGTILAKGGSPGTSGGASYQNGGAGGAVAGGSGDVQLGGAPGTNGLAVTAGAALGGNGGMAACGGGGGLNNNAGYQFGGGGGGTQGLGPLGAQTGGNGAGGVIIVTEFY
jgi:hypothetical protein